MLDAPLGDGPLQALLRDGAMSALEKASFPNDMRKATSLLTHSLFNGIFDAARRVSRLR